jgi:hypothetical protein
MMLFSWKLGLMQGWSEEDHRKSRWVVVGLSVRVVKHFSFPCDGIEGGEVGNGKWEVKALNHDVVVCE